MDQVNKILQKFPQIHVGGRVTKGFKDGHPRINLSK